RKSHATQARPAKTVAKPPPPPPAKSKAGQYGVVSAVAHVPVGGIVALVLQQARENREAAVRAAQLAAQRIAEQAREAAVRAEDEQRRLESEKVQLSVVSEPVGAIVEATWKDGVKAAVTPFDPAVPKYA